MPYETNIDDYDDIVLGSPIWNSKGVPAVNAFLKDENAAKKVTALFFLSAGGDTKKGLDALTKKLPNLKTTASLIDKKQEGSRDNDAKIEEFTASVGKV